MAPYYLLPLLLALVSSQSTFRSTPQSVSNGYLYEDLSYADLVELNATCPPTGPTDSCDVRRRDFGSSKGRTCGCDNLCPIYNDCCIDAHPKKPQWFPGSGRPTFECLGLVNFGHIYLKTECPKSWDGPSHIRNSCEHPNSTLLLKDPLTSMPVTNKVAGTTYKNYFCAICNGENSTSVAVWQPLLQFTNFKAYNATYKNVTANYIKQHLSFSPIDAKWGVWLYGEDGKLYFYDATIYPSIPSGLEEKVRECRPGLVSKCSSNWTDASVARKCGEYQAAIYVHDINKERGYRNPHCALCNGEDMNRLSCTPPKGRTGVEPRTFNNEAFSVLLDFHDPTGGQVGNQAACRSGSIFDPFHGMCKKILCGFPWLIVVNNKCVPISSTTTSSSSRTGSSLPLNKTSSRVVKDDELESKSDSITPPSIFNIPLINTTSLSQTTMAPKHIATSPLPPIVVTIEVIHPVIAVTTPEPSTTTTFESVVDEPSTTSQPDTSSEIEMDVSSTTEFEEEFSTSTLDSLIKYEPGNSANEDLEVVHLENNSTDQPDEDNSQTFPSFLDDVPQSLDYEDSTQTVSEGVNKITQQYNQDFIDCPKISLDPTEYKIMENGSLNVPAFNKIYDTADFLLVENSAYVCAFFINQSNAEVKAKFSPVMGYVTVVGLGISMICLVLHLIVFLVLPELRNLSTNNLASLSFSLLLAYIAFMVGQISTLPKIACTVVAVCTYFFFLSSFFWMSAMSFDVWRTLRLATQELRVSSGRQCKRFLLYCLYSWGLSALSVVVVLVVDNSETVPLQFRPGFATRSCWFAQRDALLVFFAAPLIAIMASNIGLFISSARMILSTTTSTSKNYSCSTSSRRNFKLYLRLAVMMGLTWTMGLIAGYMNVEILWYVFIFFNTLQGLFIFIGFTCNKKVKKFLGDKIEAITRRQAYRTSSLNSGSGYNSNSTYPSMSLKTSASNLSDTRVNPSPTNQKPMFRPSVTSFKQLQDGMETLY